MAPSPEAVYFPALEKCLDGEHPLISWSDVYAAVTDSDNLERNASVEKFLRDDSVAAILNQPLTAFPAPSPKSKTEFETKTAPIHVQPSSTGRYDINQVKQDAQWLSKEAGVEELAALRIVILEWQQRAAAQLLSEWSEEEKLSLRDATISAGFGTTTSRDPSEIAGADLSEFNNDKQRHGRLLATLWLRTALGGTAREEQEQEPEAEDQELDFFVQCLKALEDRLGLLGDSSKWPASVAEDEELTPAFATALFTELAVIMRVAFVHVAASSGISDAASVKAWFGLMDQSYFLTELQVMLQGAGELFGVVQCLVSLISLSLLNVTRSIEYVAERYAQQGAVEYPQIAGKPYLEDDECVRLLTNTVLGAADRSTQLAAPALFSWGIIAQTIRDVAYATREAQLEDGSSDSESPARLKSSLRGSRNSMARPSRIQTLLELIMDVLPGDDPIAIMGTAAVNALQVFDVVSSVSDAFGSLFSAPVDLHITAYAKLALMSLLREGLPLVQYSPGIVQALLSVISYDSPSGTTAETLSAPEPALTMVSDEDIFTPRFIGLVHSRYPHELSPLLEFSTALNQSRRSSSDQGPDVANVLDSMVTFTYKLPVDFNDYELVREDEVSNCIQLTSDLPFFESRAISTTGRLRRPKALLASDSQVPSHSEGQLAIPAGTVGVVVSDTRPFVVCWQFEHSGLEYLGNLLATRCLNSTILDAASLQPLDRLTAAQIVQLITSLLHSAADKDDPAAAKFVLGRLSYGLQRNDDIIRVVSDMFEEELQALIGRPNLEGSLPLLVACVQLMRALLTTYPERVWSFLIRSSLISVDETSCGLASVVGATEVPSGRYDFLASCTDLFAGLVEDAISRAVSRNNSNSKAVARFEDQARSSGSTPDRMLGAVLLAFERVSVDVLQSLSGWKFDIPGQRLELNAKIIATLNSVLSYHYRVGGDSDGASAKPTTFLAKASEALLDTFLADGPQQVTLQSILNIFTTTVTDVGSTISSQSRKAILAQARAALTFCSTLLSVSLITGRNAARVTSQLFKAVPIITRIYSPHSFAPLDKTPMSRHPCLAT
ncbi:hypothetical protein M8818_002304 [Zalaria obscura]|uniref:Uncharacterized protein n=1 Tax=Zalaria obscura TaxID=2024903 RepID=A0ACC3SIA4_9PEZI